MRQFINLIVGVLFFGGAVSQVQAVNNHQPSNHIVPNHYIVALKDESGDATQTIQAVSTSHGITVSHKYTHLFKGFSGHLSSGQFEQLKQDTRVAFVAEDRFVTISSHATKRIPVNTQLTPTGVNRIGASSTTNLGSGITVAVIDTGIDLSHPDLKSNIVASKSCIARKTATDDNGHGTHVAGTIAGVNNSSGVVGVAPQAKLAAVKVLDSRGSGTWSSVICGLDWITANAARYNIKVANMSLGGGGTSDNNCGYTNNDPLHQAICRSVAAGVTYVVAAGNEGVDATQSVPASYDDAVITVSALADSDGRSGGLGAATGFGADDTFASFSNYGSTVDIAAPGVDIYSTWKSGGYKTISGTSMAAPHVSGAVARFLQVNVGSNWIQVRDSLRAQGEALNAGHADSTGKHSEPVVWLGAL